MSQSLLRRIARSTSSAFIGAACLATMLVTAHAAHAQGLYQPPSLNTNTAPTPAGVASADFALTGYRGLAVTTNNNDSRTSGSLKVYLGVKPTAPSTTPVFANAVTYTTCKNPTAVLARDLNGDGYPDIAVACPSAGTVDIFFNDGATNPGAFGGANAYTASDPVAIVAGSFRNNGQIDLAVASGTGGITYFKNTNNTSEFATSTVTAAGTLSGIAAGDFNHDGILDLAVSDSASNNVHVLTGTGTGTFGAEVNYSAGAHTTGIQTADFNTDGYLDLAVTTSGNNVSILNGSAAGFTLYSTQAAGTDPIALSITDVNSDGAPDVVAYDAQTAGSATVGAIAVLLGNGNGTLQTAQISTLSAVPGTYAAVDDFNRDGKPDLAIIQSSDVVSLLLNNTLPTAYPDGRSYAGYSPVAAGNGNMADGIATGDFNRDGQLDVAVSYLQDSVVRVLRNNGGAFTLSGTYPVGNQPYSVTSGDLNGDGYPDLVTANFTDGTISVLLNNGVSGINNTFNAAATYTVGKQPYQVAIGDVNGDGYPDLAVTNYGANTVSILYGSKAGTFTAGPTLTTGANPYGVVIGDFQHDGYPDVAVTCFGVDMLYVFRNTKGTLSTTTPFMIGTGSGPMTLVTGDFNRDGKLDIVVANATGGPAGDTNPQTSGNNISFFAGTEILAAPFSTGVIGPSLNFPDVIAAGDVNGDGILDIVGVAPNFNSVEVTLGAGDGTFGTIQQRAAGEFSALKQPWALALGDFNNDGQLDIVTANTYNAVDITTAANLYRYMTQYPPVGGGVPSVDLLSNASAANISLTITPDTFPLPAKNSGVTLTATVSPALSGPTPTGSVGFEDASGNPLGTSPYTLNDGSAGYSTGQLGSGQHLFTTLYSGDANFQPTTSSGTAFAVTVTGTPVTLTLSSDSVVYGDTDTATVTVTQTGATVPTGTVTIYGAPGNFQLPVITLAGGTGQRTFTVDNPDFNVGTYQLYAYYTPANGSPYVAGSSSDVQLQVTPDPTSITNNCLELFISGCEATVTPTYGAAYVPSDISFSVNGGAATNEPISAAGDALFPYTFGDLDTYTVVAAYIPPNGNYLASSASATVTCETILIRVCFGGGSGDIARPVSIPLTSFIGFGPGKSVSSRTDQTRQSESFSRFPMF